jgi:hypothetical protein
VLRFLKDNLQLLLILGAPVSSTLPAGVFVYWLTSSLFGHAQHFALKSPGVRAALGFPPMLAPPSPTPTPAAAASGAAGGGGAAVATVGAVGGGMVVDPRLMAKAMEALEAYEAGRQRRLEQEGGAGSSREARSSIGGREGEGEGKEMPPRPGLSAFPKRREK